MISIPEPDSSGLLPTILPNFIFALRKIILFNSSASCGPSLCRLRAVDAQGDFASAIFLFSSPLSFSAPTLSPNPRRDRSLYKADVVDESLLILN